GAAMRNVGKLGVWATGGSLLCVALGWASAGCFVQSNDCKKTLTCEAGATEGTGGTSSAGGPGGPGGVVGAARGAGRGGRPGREGGHRRQRREGAGSMR